MRSGEILRMRHEAVELVPANEFRFVLMDTIVLMYAKHGPGRQVTVEVGTM